MGYLDELERKDTFFSAPTTAIPAISAINEQNQDAIAANGLLLPATLEGQPAILDENSNKIADHSNGVANFGSDQSTELIEYNGSRSKNSRNSEYRRNKETGDSIWCSLNCGHGQRRLIDDLPVLWCNDADNAVISLQKCPKGHWVKDKNGRPMDPPD